MLIFLFFVGCEDKSYIVQTYDKKLLSSKISCLKLNIQPYSKVLFNSSKNLYHFSSDCDYELVILHKSNIVCNSPYNTNRSFHKFVELDLKYKNKTFYTIYKDLKDNNKIQDEIKKGYKYLCKQIKLQ